MKKYYLDHWLNRKDKLPGVRKANIRIGQECIAIQREFKRMSVILAFLTLKCKLPYMRTMWNSVNKHKRFIGACIIELKKYQIENEYVPSIEKELKKWRERIVHINRIIKEDIRLTEYGAWFEECFDWGMFDDYQIATSFEEVQERIDKGLYTDLDYLDDEIKAWNIRNPEKVAKHMESIREELEIKARHKEIIKAKQEHEKAVAKAAKKAETAEIREMRYNHKNYIRRSNKIMKELETTMRHV